jgi:hypothetical protein
LIARVAVGGSAVAALDDAGARADVFARHASICEALEAHGYLVIGNPDEGRELVRAIQSSSPEVGQLWTQLVTRFTRVGRFHNVNPPCSSRLDELRDIEELRAGWGADTDLAVVTDRLAALLGLSAAELSRLDALSGIEIARAAVASFVPPLRDHKALRDVGVLRCGESRERLWDSVLMPIVRVARAVTVVDRYLFTNLANRVSAGDSAESFLAWLLSRMDQHAQQDCSLLLVGFDSRPGGDVPHADAAAALLRSVFVATGGRLGQIEVATTQPASYLPHDRHIGANIGVAVSFAASFGTLDSQVVAAQEGLEWTYRFHPDAVAKTQAAEQRFLQDRSAQRVVAIG